MGCRHSTSRPVAGGGERLGKGKSDRPPQLLAKYTLGDVLGQGAFGVVFSCNLIFENDQKFAVKLVDKVETPLIEIRREAEMMKLLWDENNPCVVRLYEVFYESVFVCFVMDLHIGGDMIKGMQRHWKTYGQFRIARIQELNEQMFCSICWLHSKDVIHRDIKGDNYLMSTRDIGERACKIFLSDFGTVRQLTPGERLKTHCGTRVYWAPELYDRDYSLKVDVWAGGVITYGLITGRFPFRDEEDVRKKALHVDQRATLFGVKLVEGCLNKIEAKRFSAREAHEHEFNRNIVKEEFSPTKATEELTIRYKSSGPDAFPEDGVEAVVADRRRLLVERFERAHEAIATTPLKQTSMPRHFADLKKLTFDVEQNRREIKMSYTWWFKEHYEPVLKTLLKNVKLEMKNKPALNMRSMLIDYGVNIDMFGKGASKTFDEFLAEVEKGGSRLMLDATKHKTMVRVVRVVLVRITDGAQHYLINTGMVIADKAVKAMQNHLPSTEIAPQENAVQAARRLLKERMNIEDRSVNIDADQKEIFEDDELSPDYAGVRTVYMTQIVEAKILASDPKLLERIGLSEWAEPATWSWTDAQHNTYTFRWLTEDECKTMNVRLRAPAVGTFVSPLVPVPVAYNEDELQRFLFENKVDKADFGREGYLPYSEFTGEFAKGEASLSKRNGKIVRIVQLVLLQIYNKDTDTVLFESSMTSQGKTTLLGRLPATKQRPDELSFFAARRHMQTVMNINDNLVDFDPEVVEVGDADAETASPTFCELPTIYRKVLLTGRLAADRWKAVFL